MAAVILAAGGGRRFGGRKLLAPLHGRPLVAYVLELVRRACDVGLVTGGHLVMAGGDAALAELARAAGVRTVANDAPDRGLSSSLRLGLAALGADAGAAILLLADQPLVRLDVLAELIGAWRERRGVLIRPRYADAPGEPGHPVLADRSVWPLAERLEGDAGLAAVISPHSPGAAFIDVAGRNPDVDTPADLHTLEGSWP
ncbi:MAG TPA: NTP transferase domain-containing protein [Gemmatimonadales bacterium]|nr:NTP transferase domain-containing protein [Gemmatimonadales bacterium]